MGLQGGLAGGNLLADGWLNNCQPLPAFLMITKWLLIPGLSVLVASVGCNHAPSDVPADGFRLTVQDIVTDVDMRVSQLAIVSSATATIVLDSDLSHSSLRVPESAKGAPGRASVTLAADRIAPSGERWAYMHYLISDETSTGRAGLGLAFEALPIDTKLSNYFTIAATAGDYAFDTPVEIATLRGKSVTLTLKRGAK